ncbi:Xaa-Pro aminopeptidase [Methanohalophilus levihalophilus]|uniref:M24 family metallopeptidase n=1 Tax=Methanohalophilus levihalophilus TaxID=1431282 RepID=UPI001AE8E554|nr:Xaa-Pro peptidase family protein [Methanohalophilus levihalophilus]MBP2029945.1 Xaa-Pro aminopeptidase [Methanohalophilus levihalophilus]
MPHFDKNTNILETLLRERADTYLIIGNSSDADLYYATEFLAADPFSYMQTKQSKELLLVSSMELGRARNESRITNILTLEDCDFRKKVKETGDSSRAYAECLAGILQNEGVRTICVPYDFPYYTAQVLKENGFSIISTKSPFKTIRAVKAKEEVSLVRGVQKACEKAMENAIDLIRNAEIRDDVLYSDDKALTSETVRYEIEKTLLEYGCEADSTIVAGGEGSSNPHWAGEGKLSANDPIVIDIFPRHKVHRYHADMTRTVLKGEASEKLVSMYEAVKAAQEAAFKVLKSGVLASEVHTAVCDEFRKRGYNVGTTEGFMHSTGHGVGIEIHELPAVSTLDVTLEAGNIITIEPGLYYPEIGGIRLEDMVVVTENGYENLTNFPKEFVL